ncbi:MAG: hypothetical protein QNJ53_04770 [Pleurocapsa sp. MO_192.B19]|nr:hypothetical protein [Pleurocapsa sp. MO_192.B19]
MTSSEDFKQAIRAGNIKEAFLVAMSNAPELNITTRIISAEGKEPNTNQSQVDNYLRTHISLIEGTIENEIGEQFTGDRYGEIKQFHIEQVNQGHQTIQHNLISLQKMFQLMSTFQQQQQAAEHSSWVEIAADVTRESLSAKPETNQLYGNKTPDALEAGKTVNQTEVISSEVNLDIETDQAEPQLPSFKSEEDDSVVDDLLSLADIDDEPEEKEHSSAEEADWGDWLEDEPEVKTEVFDLKSLNLRQSTRDWQNWEAHHPSDSQPTKDQP